MQGSAATRTFSMKFALEHIGFGPCYHMVEMFAGMRARPSPCGSTPVTASPTGTRFSRDINRPPIIRPASIWRELADYYPEAKVILTTRDPESWFESVQRHDLLAANAGLA